MGHPGALDQLGTSVASGSFANHRLRSTPSTDFQPPYFPPPYPVPQQPVEFPHHPHHVNTDPYAHLNHYNSAHHQQYTSVSHAERHHLFPSDPLSSFPRHLAAAQYDARREYDVSVSRPDVFAAPRGPHDIHNSALLGLSGTPQGLGGLDDPSHVSTY